MLEPIVMTCTIEVLKCLEKCTQLPMHIIKRYKKEVIDGMELFLAHPKRRVRRHAVQTVNKWHQII